MERAARNGHYTSSMQLQRAAALRSFFSCFFAACAAAICSIVLTRFVNQNFCKVRPQPQTLNGELERTDLLAFGLSGVERSGVHVRERVDGWIRAPAEACIERGPADQTRKAISAVLCAKVLPATLGR
jgi:hypothetical protein